MAGHSSNVQSIAFSNDERYLFSGGDDNSVVIWDFESSCQELCRLKVPFPVYTVQITQDSQFLLCVSKAADKTCFFALEENKDAIRLNFSIRTIQECYVTGDEEFLVLTNQKE